MRFSEAFNVTPDKGDDWFDVILSTDTRLFVDPFRVYVDQSSQWGDAHDHLIAFFNMVLKQIAKADGKKSSAHWKAAQRLMMFPEPPEFCLGYGDTPMGLGTADELGAAMMKSAQTTVKLGIKSVRHFEELTLFEDHIGADRISDIVCNVLKSYFIRYTASVCKRHSVVTSTVSVPHAGWDSKFEIWTDARVELPVNPFTQKAVLLTPTRFLRKLPTVEPEEFWDWCWVNENENIRGQFNYDLGKNVDAGTIARFARQNAKAVRKYVKSLEKAPKPAYDLASDPSGEVNWYDAALALAREATAPPQPQSASEFCAWVEGLLEDFAHNIEQQDGWQLLWVKDRPRSERLVQALFRAAVWQICEALDIDFSGEANAGRGPVDFKFSKGSKRRTLVEVKLTKHSQYWHGLQKQLPQYMTSEKIRCGYFLSVGFTDNDFETQRKKRVTDVAKDVSGQTDYDIKVVFVDARRKASASKKK